MPNCFQLRSKVTGEPMKFAQIDNEMREHFKEPPDDERWLEGWYDCIGFALACGKDWTYCRETFTFEHPIVDYLEERYTYNAWVEIGKR